MTIVSTTVLRNNLSDTLNEINGIKDFILVAKKGKITTTSGKAHSFKG